jgi:hypothetical protein
LILFLGGGGREQEAIDISGQGIQPWFGGHDENKLETEKKMEKRLVLFFIGVVLLFQRETNNSLHHILISAEGMDWADQRWIARVVL